MKFSITGMSCAACSSRVEKAVSGLDGVKKCSVNLLTNSMIVDGDANVESIISAVEKAGYGAYVDGKINKDNVKSEINISNRILKIIFSVFFVLVLMYFSMGHMLRLPIPLFFKENHIATALIQMILSSVVIVINQNFFIKGFKGLLKGTANMDTLVSVGSGASFVYSVYLVFRMTLGENHIHGLYFDSAAMILTLISVGKMLEAYSKGKTTSAINSLIALKPQNATVIRDNKEKVVNIDEVVVGDIFVIKPGESIPVDGVIIEGFSSVDESALTGESVPVDKKVNDKISAATLNVSGFLKCKATGVGEDTALARIIKTVSDASAGKAPIAKIADRVAGIFVPVVVILSVITWVTWFFISKDFAHSFERAISVLVISCPCALGLATPVAIMVGNGVAARKGILFKTASSLEEAARTKYVIFDKTGTITEGKPQVTDVFSDDNNKLLKYAYSVERKSEHPLAKAIVKKAEELKISSFETSNFIAHSGHGVSCEIDGKTLVGGNFEFLNCEIDEKYLIKAKEYSSVGKTPLFFSFDNEFLGIIAVADVIKNDSKQAIESLKQMGIHSIMLTGDNDITAKVIADNAGISEYKANVLPENKALEIKEMQKYGKVMMVGDGINDAPALVTADVGVAIGTGTDIAIDSADVILMNSSLMDVVKSIKISRAVLKIIKQNLFWAFVYNCIGIPLAAGVFIPILGWEMNPMFGAAAMSLSSFCVISNALRLNFLNIKDKEKKMKKVIKIGGMMCGHCEARVKKLLENFTEVDEAIVSYKKGTAILSLNSELSDEKIREAIENDGYTFE